MNSMDDMNNKLTDFGFYRNEFNVQLSNPFSNYIYFICLAIYGYATAKGNSML